ncbi:hypothetical protein EYF80_028767 [Liparis tanakae]|uniref:Uncharacterized protein n=1 Tax=Liparis tanakae TaxID=230148 RepID=A0A4Z2H5D6_9TELE|nr:hypothetical protein EYF80_028767 [Liparis tanakae]
MFRASRNANSIYNQNENFTGDPPSPVALLLSCGGQDFCRRRRNTLRHAGEFSISSEQQPKPRGGGWPFGKLSIAYVTTNGPLRDGRGMKAPKKRAN